jgi:hypothetical protein
MKTLSAQELIELLPPTPDELGDGLAAFELSAPVMCREPGYLKELIDEGWMQASTIHVNGRPAFLIGWHISTDRGLWFDFVQSLSPDSDHAVAITTVERLAAQNGCRYVRWTTLRRGIVKWAQDFGYIPEAIILTKKL